MTYANTGLLLGPWAEKTPATMTGSKDVSLHTLANMQGGD